MHFSAAATASSHLIPCPCYFFNAIHNSVTWSMMTWWISSAAELSWAPFVILQQRYHEQHNETKWVDCSLASASVHPSTLIFPNVSLMHDPKIINYSHQHPQYPAKELKLLVNLCLSLIYLVLKLVFSSISWWMWLRVIVVLFALQRSICFVLCLDMRAVVSFFAAAAAAQVKQLADTWVARPVQSLSESHRGTVDVAPGLSAARGRAGVRLWTSS